MNNEREDSNFRIDVQFSEDTANITIIMPRSEYEQLMHVLNDRNLMAPICRVVDKSALGEALRGSTYCARCKNQFGNISESHQFKAKNWASATSKAFWYCKGSSYILFRGTCGTEYGNVVIH